MVSMSQVSQRYVASASPSVNKMRFWRFNRIGLRQLGHIGRTRRTMPEDILSGHGAACDACPQVAVNVASDHCNTRSGISVPHFGAYTTPTVVGDLRTSACAPTDAK